jgi:cytosine/adenosine deaminase-related metal-dependent hydrolase
MGSFLLRDASILTVDSSDTKYSEGWISVADGRITGVGPALATPTVEGFDEVLSLHGHLIMPGLVIAAVRRGKVSSPWMDGTVPSASRSCR